MSRKVSRGICGCGDGPRHSPMLHRVLQRQVNGVCDPHRAEGLVSCYCGMSPIDIAADRRARLSHAGRPADLPSAKALARGKPHGDRLRYISGCRCAKCRASNTAYARKRAAARKAGDWNGFVDAAAARAHIVKLARKRVGYKMVAEAAKISSTTVLEIKRGRQTTCRARTARKILAVTTAVRGDAALISSLDTRQRIAWFLDEGFSKGEIARLLGYKNGALQFRSSLITVRNAARVERLWQKFQK